MPRIAPSLSAAAAAGAAKLLIVPTVEVEIRLRVKLVSLPGCPAETLSRVVGDEAAKLMTSGKLVIEAGYSDYKFIAHGAITR